MRAAHLVPLPPSPVSPEVLTRAETLGGAFEELARRHPAHVGFAILDRHWQETRATYGQLYREAKVVQQALEARGVGAGDTVLLVFPTCMDLVAGYFGTLLAGGVPAILATPSHRVANLDLYREHLGLILGNADAKVLYCEDEVARLLEGEAAGVLGGAAVLRPAQLTPALAPSSTLPETRRVSPRDFGTIQYSSGSTGEPKGVLLEHGAILNHVRSLREGLGITPSDVSVDWIPLYHDMGLIDAFLLPLLAGCPTVLIPTMDFLREPSLWLHAIGAYRGTISWSPNFGYSLCAKRLRDEELQGLDLSSWRLAMSAAEPVLAETVEAFQRRFEPFGFAPDAMTPSWGLAESCVIVTSHAPGEPTRIEHVDRTRLGRDAVAVPVSEDAPDAMPSVGVGAPLPRARVEIRDEDREPLPDRRVGEVWIQTDCLFTAYKNEPALTAETRVDGWFDTGDRGYLVDGHLFFVARSKDLIVIGGENYAPHDVEAAINRVPGVRDGCAVAFGVMNEPLGTEELAAVVETRVEDEAERKALADAIRREVSRSLGLGLRYVHLVPPLGIQKTTSGKLARRATRDRYPEIFGRHDVD